jgi:hypothetical protein
MFVGRREKIWKRRSRCSHLEISAIVLKMYIIKTNRFFFVFCYRFLGVFGRKLDWFWTSGKNLSFNLNNLYCEW